MLTVFVFDERESRREEDLQPALDGLGEKALLWVALRDPSEAEVGAVREVFDLSEEQAQRLLEQPARASLVDAGEHLHVTLYVASGEGGEPVLRPVECVLGPNWVVTSHEAEIEVLDLGLVRRHDPSHSTGRGRVRPLGRCAACASRPWEAAACPPRKRGPAAQAASVPAPR